MIEIHGTSASSGIIIGKVLLFLDENFAVPEYAINKAKIENEISRLESAILKSRKELDELRKSYQSAEKDAVQILFVDAHIMMLNDPVFIDDIHNLIKNDCINAEKAVYQTTKKMVSMLEATGDEYLKERTFDIYDVSKRILNNLMLKKRVSLTNLAEPVVVVGKNLLPSDTLAMDKRNILGIAMEMGGKTSHTAILARSFGIPAVLALKELVSNVNDGDAIIVDGYRGKVILNPDNKTLNKYKNIIKEHQQRAIELMTLNNIPAETLDGKRIELKANIEVVDEIEFAHSYAADGIGLFRSEFLLMKPGIAHDEEVQYLEYRKVIEGMMGKPVTIRTLDIGGDKAIPHLLNREEENPILGCRSVRFCLREKDLFKIQLRAILRAGVHGNVQVMFPMISGAGELDEVLEVWEEAKAELKASGKEFKEDLPVGVMIEVPSAALTSDVLAKKVDFFSIGTNDLIQYTVAVDRGNDQVAYLYNSFHLGIIRLLKMVIDNAHENNIPVTMCGEMASDPYATVLLLGLGLDAYSMTSSSIPEVKQIIRSISVVEAQELVDKILNIELASEIEQYVRKWMNERFKFFGV